MNPNERKTDMLSIDDVWPSSEPIVLHSWLDGPQDPGQVRTITLAWLKTNEPELMGHIGWLLNAVDDMEFGQYERLVNGRKKDDWGYYPRSLYDHACSRTITDIGCFGLAEWATGLCEYQRGTIAAEKAMDPDASATALDEEDAREWARLVAEAPRLREIEARARRFEMPPHLRGTFAGVYRGWPLYGQLYGEAMRLITDLYDNDTSGGLKEMVHDWAVAQAVIANAMYPDL